MKYKILQINKPTMYRFMNYDYALWHNFSLKDYQEVYEGTIYDHNDPIEEVLESIFMLLNCKIPDDYHGHSLSVSDIIELEDGRKFYIELVSFKEIK